MGRRMKERGTERKRKEKRRQRREGNSKKNGQQTRWWLSQLRVGPSSGSSLRAKTCCSSALSGGAPVCVCVTTCRRLPLALGKRSSTV